MIHLIVGNTGAGKTTYAQLLKEQTQGIVFSIDQWNATLFIPDKTELDGLDWFLERIERSETLILSLIEQLEAAHTDTILDLGFSKFKHRQKFRDFASLNGFKTTLHFLDVSKKERLNRVMSRNQEQGKTYAFKVSQADFNFMETWFEPLSSKELEDAVVINNV